MMDSTGVALQNLITSTGIASSAVERFAATANKFDLSQMFGIAREKIKLVGKEFDSTNHQIVESTAEQENLNKKIRDGSEAAKTLKGVFDKLGGFETIKKVVKISDEWVQNNTRLDLIVDDGGSVEELRKKIFSSAQSSRALYTDMVPSITKLGLSARDSFNNTDEIIKFTEMVQKMGTISGLPTPEISGTADKINQTMSSGQLQDSDYESIMESMPILEQIIADYMGVGSDKLKELASQGKITSDIIKSAMFSASGEIDEKFEQIPMTWGQVWNDISNNILMYAQPILKFINLLANNWSVLEPIVLGVVSVLGAYLAILSIVNIVQGISAIATAVHTAFRKEDTKATFAQSVAQNGLNKALLACPLTWILLIIVGLVAVFYAVIAAVNKFVGTTLSATGIIIGALAMLGAFLWNAFIGIVNGIIQLFWTLFITPFISIMEWVVNIAMGGFNSFGDGVANLLGQIISWFLSLGKVVTKIIDAIFGTDWTSGLSSLQDSVLGWGKNKDAITLERTEPKFDSTITYESAWDKGYKFGEGIEDKLSNTFSFDDMNNFDVPGTDTLNADDLGNLLDVQEYDVNVKDEVNLADESLKYLLDEVTQKYINNINLQAPAPNVSVQIDVANGSDLDLDELAEKTKQKIGTEILEFSMSSTDIKH